MWKDTIKKANYNFSKSKFWGNLGTVPNELGLILSEIESMTKEERNDKEVQDDIEYIKELCEYQMKRFERILNIVNNL